MDYKQHSSSRRRDCPKQILEVCSEDLQDEPADDVQATIRSLCQFCIDHGFLQRMSQFSLDSESSREIDGIYTYGSREDLRSRSACSFCRLVNRLLPLDLPSSTQIQIRPRLEHPQDRHLEIYAGTQFQMSVEVVSHGLDKPDAKVYPKIEPAEICVYLQRCENSHDHSRLKDNRLYHTPIDLTFISVPEGRLVRGSSRDRYFALSYVWGGISMFQTTMSNRSSFEEPGSLTSVMEKIPATIQDSIALMQTMGERYLWVDSLCIEQDNKSQKHTQISQMDSIYSQAVATIVALSSTDAASGLPGVRKDSLLPSSVSETIHELGIEVKTSPPAIIDYISTTCYESRAWTFQERLLSKRCLLFTNIGTYFHCSEGLINVQDVQLQVCEAQFNSLPDCLLSKSDRRSDWASAFPGYAGLVRDYTKRHLSYSSDALNAFSGLLELFKHRFDGNIISGLPSSILDAALLWVSVEEHPTRNVHFPSWSWAGWIGQVQYWPLLASSSIDGCNSSKQQTWDNINTTNSMRPLESAISHFKFAGQLLQRDIDESLSKTPPLTSSTSNNMEFQNHPGKEKTLRDVLEFDAFVVNIAKLAIHQMCYLQQDYNSRTDFKGVYGTVISADGDLRSVEQHSTDLVLLSRFSPPPLSSSERHADSSGTDPDWNCVDGSPLEIREGRLLNLMIVAWDAERKCAERIGLCVLREDIWNKHDPRMMHIKLA